MLTKAQFLKLKVGDVVLFNGRPRTVRDINKVHPLAIYFSILHRSWTGRVQTCYHYNGIKRIVSLPRKERDRRDVCHAEEAALLANGFDVLAGVEREIKDEEYYASRGLNVNKKAIAFAKQVRRKLKRRK